MELTIEVTGIPKPQGRPKFVRTPYFTHVYSPKTDWFEQVYNAALTNKLNYELDCPLELTIVFTLPKPTNARKSDVYAFKKPDLDNLAKAVMDAFSKARFWTDDSRVVKLNCTKQYSSASTPTGAAITIRVI